MPPSPVPPAPPAPPAPLAPGRLLALVADDLGRSPGANAGIAAALDAGAVRETSLMVTGTAVEEGARLARAAGAAVGLHLSFTEGRALTGPLRGLTRGDGRFLGLPSVLVACRLGLARPDQVLREAQAQLGRLESLGLTVAHLNGHHHAHAFPVVREVVARLAVERRVPYVRVPLEGPATAGRLSLRRWVVARQARGLARALHGVGRPPSPAAFAGLGLESRRDFGPRLLRLLGRLPAGPAELMVHPRREGPDGEAEAAFLADRSLPRRLEELGWRCGTLAELGAAQAGGGSGP